MPRLRLLALLAPFALLSGPSFAGDDDEPGKVTYKKTTQIDFSEMSVPAPMPSVASTRMSATPGGAQDIRYFRGQVKAGAVPHPNVFTPEGLFSEHDLPGPDGAACAQLLCPVGAAMPAELTVQPDVRILAQLGFQTDIDAETFHRAPVNLVAVVDKSGSMSGAPLQTVKDSLHRVVDQLGPQDHLSIVLYGDTAHT